MRTVALIMQCWCKETASSVAAGIAKFYNSFLLREPWNTTLDSMYYMSFFFQINRALICFTYRGMSEYRYFFSFSFSFSYISVERNTRRCRKSNSEKVNVIANIFNLKRRLGEIDRKIRSLFISRDTSLVSNGGLKESQIMELNRLKWTFCGSKDMRIDRAVHIASISPFIILSTIQRDFSARVDVSYIIEHFIIEISFYLYTSLYIVHLFTPHSLTIPDSSIADRLSR